MGRSNAGFASHGWSILGMLSNSIGLANALFVHSLQERAPKGARCLRTAFSEGFAPKELLSTERSASLLSKEGMTEALHLYPLLIPMVNHPQAAKKCPHCAEEILIEAKKCKHCGEFLDSKREKTKRSNISSIITLLAVGAVAASFLAGFKAFAWFILIFISPFIVTYQTCLQRNRRLSAPLLCATFFFGWLAVILILCLLEDRSQK